MKSTILVSVGLLSMLIGMALKNDGDAKESSEANVEESSETKDRLWEGERPSRVFDYNCPQCGEKVAGDWAECHYCGERLNRIDK